MEYWQGYMDWPLDKDWTCELCGHNAGLTWGMVHAVCRCNHCHCIYSMRQDDAVVTTPVKRIKAEYWEAVKILWGQGVKVDNMTGAHFARFGL